KSATGAAVVQAASGRGWRARSKTWLCLGRLGGDRFDAERPGCPKFPADRPARTPPHSPQNWHPFPAAPKRTGSGTEPQTALASAGLRNAESRTADATARPCLCALSDDVARLRGGTGGNSFDQLVSVLHSDIFLKP